MSKLLLWSTLVLLVLLLLAAACHAEEASGSVAEAEEKEAEGQGPEPEEGNEEEDEEGENEEDLEVGSKEEKATLLLGAGSRLIRTNALPATASEDSELPTDAGKQRELAIRVRELLSRLPIIPLSQQPVLHKETLVVAAPDPASATLGPAPALASATLAAGVPDIPAPVEPISTPTQVGPAIRVPVSRAPAAAALAALIAAPLLLDKKSAVSDDLPDNHIRRARAAALVATPLYGGLATTHGFPAAFTTGRQHDYRISNLPLAVTAETPGTTGTQPEVVHPSLVDLVPREEPHVAEVQHLVSPTEFVRVFDVMNAFNTLVNWVENIKQELNSSDSGTSSTQGEEETAERPAGRPALRARPARAD